MYLPIACVVKVSSLAQFPINHQPHPIVSALVILDAFFSIFSFCVLLFHLPNQIFNLQNLDSWKNLLDFFLNYPFIYWIILGE